MTIKKDLENEIDDRWRNKGGTHIKDRNYIPKVCPVCKGIGTTYDCTKDEYLECTECNGLGEV